MPSPRRHCGCRLARWRIVLLAGGAVCLSAEALRAQSASAAVTVPRLAGPVTLDGRVDEPAWQAVPVLAATQMWPTEGATPSERTEFRVAYDDDYVWFSCRNFDREPDGIRATSLRRDDGSLSNDWCVLSLDTYGDGESLTLFGVSPAGVRTDVVFSDDGDTENFTWNTYWDAEAARDGAGWSVEVRVPISSLRFQVMNDTTRMGLLVWRGLARRNELITWPAVPNRWGQLSMLKASQAGQAVFVGLRSRTPVYVTPYGLTGGGLTHERDSVGAPWMGRHPFEHEAGLDVKAGLTRNLTLDLTVNTDFAQVEADDQQVNLTRFSLFFPERRLFFQERNSIFEVPLGGSDRVFYSRRIGLVSGEPVRIYGGGRLVGRVGGWDVGLLDMQADRPGAGTDNAGVLRVRRQVFNANSYAGGIVTSRLGSTGAYNVTAGADAIVRAFGQDYVSLVLAQSFDDTDSAGLDAADRGMARVRWERRGQFGLLYELEGAWAGAAFDPALGFVSRRDVSRASGSLAWGARGAGGSWLQRRTVSVGSSVWVRNADGRTESAETSAQLEFQARRGHTFSVGANATHEDLDAAFDLADSVTVPAGTYDFATVQVDYASPNVATFRPIVGLEAGRFYDGTRVSVRVSPTWRMSRGVTVSGTWALDRIRFDSRGQSLTAHVARLRAQVATSRALSASAFVQLNSAADVVITNARVRYNPREGVDLYVVFNEARNTHRFAESPALPRIDSRTLLVKYSHALRLEL